MLTKVMGDGILIKRLRHGGAVKRNGRSNSKEKLDKDVEVC